MMLIKLDGEPARGPVALGQSLALRAVLAETDVADTASNKGDTDGIPLVGIEAGAAGSSSGDWNTGDSSGGVTPLPALPLL